MTSIFITQKVGLKSLLFVFMLVMCVPTQAQTPKIIKGIIKSNLEKTLIFLRNSAVLSKKNDIFSWNNTTSINIFTFFEK